METGSFMIKDIIIIDDFLPPELLDSFMDNKRKFEVIDRVYYAGETHFPTPEEVAELNKVLIDKNLFSYNGFNIRLRRTSPENSHDYKSFVHIDTFCEFSGIIYLDSTSEDNIPTGTYFWQHKVTGRKMTRLDHLKNQFVDNAIVESDSKDISRWECWKKVEFVNNRAIFFPANFFHSPVPPNLFSGDRLTIDLFFNKLSEFKYVD